MKISSMFTPIRIGSMTVPNRFVVPPMGNNFANTDGTLSETSKAYYLERALGGFGLITIESSVVDKKAKGGPRKPCLYDDSTIDSFKNVIDACHDAGSKVSIQLQHAGSEGNEKVAGHPLKAASAIPASNGRNTPLAITTEEIYELIESYGDAALRAKTHPDRKTTPRPVCHGIPAPITKEYVKNAFNPIPGARANGAFPKIANISVPMAVASMVTVIRAALSIPASDNIAGFTKTMYAIVKNVVTPPITSVLRLEPRSLNLNILSKKLNDELFPPGCTLLVFGTIFTSKKL